MPLPAPCTPACRPATPAEAAVYVSPITSPGVISPKDGTCYRCHLPRGGFVTADSLYGAPVHFGELFSMNVEFAANRQLSLSLPMR